MPTESIIRIQRESRQRHIKQLLGNDDEYDILDINPNQRVEKKHQIKDSLSPGGWRDETPSVLNSKLFICGEEFSKNS